MKRYFRILVVLLVVMVMAFSFKSLLGKKEKTVGKDVRIEDVKDFYYTVSSSTNPPRYQRYRFFVNDGKYYFYHEKREGDHWPLNESDVTVSGEIELSEQQWQQFFDCLANGKVSAREENLDSGSSGPWLYLYWSNDKGNIQQFEFESLAKKSEFEQLCAELKG
ncbi:MAG: hypothetical protein IJM15_00370 [Erysipelotrichaceae bacterium]|nr:hypothetical protein [Erysipelotrichaceae bacterium]